MTDSPRTNPKELLTEIREDLAKALDRQLFEGTDPTSLSEAAIEVLHKYAKYARPRYKVVCDETNNTDKDMDNGVVNADIYLDNLWYQIEENEPTITEKRAEAEEYWKELYGDYPDEDDENWYLFLDGWEIGMDSQWLEDDL